jgi:hypothetical protein
VQLVDTGVCIWVARIDPDRWNTIVRAWYSGSKVREWVEWRVDNETEWETLGSTDSQVLHGTAADGDTDVKVRRVEILDQVALADRYPDELLSAR